MRVFFSFLFFSFEVLAIDYGLCSKFLKAGPISFLSMDKNGNVTADPAKVDYYNAEDPKNIKLKKSWIDKNDSSVIHVVSVEVRKRDDGTVSINKHESALRNKAKVAQANYGGGFYGGNSMGHYPMGVGFIGLINPYSEPLGADAQAALSGRLGVDSSMAPNFSEDTEIVLMVKNNKCYPESVDFLRRVNPVGGFGSRHQSFSISARSKTCRKILDYFDNNPSLKKCTNADALKGLNKILKYSPGAWKAGNKLLEELDKNLSEASKIIGAATRELTKCNNFFLTESVQDDELWKVENQKNNVTEKVNMGISK